MANNFAEKNYNQLAQEVQDFEIDKLLGSAFYQAVVATPEDYTNLLDAYEFTRADATQITHKGLRYVIAYLNYAKYIGESDIFDTTTGQRTKVTPDSEPLATGRIKARQQEMREIAFNAFILIREYLNLNATDYPLWGCASDKKRNKSMFYPLKKTKL